MKIISLEVPDDFEVDHNMGILWWNENTEAAHLLEFDERESVHTISYTQGLEYHKLEFGRLILVDDDIDWYEIGLRLISKIMNGRAFSRSREEYDAKRAL